MNLPKEYSSNLDISCYQIFMWNKLAKQDEILLRKKNNEVFGRLFVQCFANVWPTGCQLPQTDSDGAVCFAKCKHDTLNTLIHSNLLAFQRGRILI